MFPQMTFFRVHLYRLFSFLIHPKSRMLILFHYLRLFLVFSILSRITLLTANMPISNLNSFLPVSSCRILRDVSMPSASDRSSSSEEAVHFFFAILPPIDVIRISATPNYIYGTPLLYSPVQ